MNQLKIIKISQKTNGRCFYCNSSNANEIDHFTCRKEYNEYIEDLKRLDLIKTKEDEDNCELKNLFICCSKCNRKKGNKDPAEFMGGYTISWSRYYRANARVGLMEKSEKVKGWFVY